MLVRAPVRRAPAPAPAPTRTANRSATARRPAVQRQTRLYATAPNAFSPATGSLQAIDDAVYGRLEEVRNEFKELKAKNQKASVDKYNELLGANIFRGDIGGIVEAVDLIVKDGVSPNNTTVRLMNYFFGKTDNFVKGESLLEKLEDLHNISSKAAADLNAALPARKQGGYLVPSAKAEKFGQVLNFSDGFTSELTDLFQSWHTSFNSKKEADQKAYKERMNTTMDKIVDSEFTKQVATKLGVPILNEKSFAEGKNGKLMIKDKKLREAYKAKVKVVKHKLTVSKQTITAVAQYLGSQPFTPAMQVNFADLLSFQRTFQNTHGELKKYFYGVRVVALANLIISGAPALPAGKHPLPALFLSSLVNPKDYAAVEADVKGDSSVTFINPAVSAAKAVKPLLESHERWFADYYDVNDDLKTY